LPVPDDPLDPVLRVVLLSKLASASSTPLNLVHPIADSQFPKKNDVIDVFQPVNFKVNFEIRKEFPNLRFPSIQQNASILSAFKEIRQALPSAGRRHTGLDLAVKEQPVIAALDGIADDIRDQPIIAVGANNPTVVQPNYTGDSCRELNDGYGKKIGRIGGLRLWHDFSTKGQLFTRYLHLKPGTINLPDPMHAGDLIATSGTSGACKKPFTCVPNMTTQNGVCKLYATGLPAYHLHFDVLSDNKLYIDPRPLLPAINDTSLFLLPHDNVNPSSKDIGLSPEPHLRLRLVLNNGSPMLGVNEIDKQFVTDFATITTQVSGGEIQTGSVKGSIVGKTKLTNSIDNYGGSYANIAYDSGSLTLSTYFKAAASHPFYQQNGLKLEDIVEQSKVVLELCTFRLSLNCIQIASWDLNQKSTQVTADATTGSTGKGTVTSEPVVINCQTGSSNQCSYAFSAGDTVKLTATPSTDLSSYSTFAGWSGSDADKCVAGSAPTVCNLPLDSIPKNITAMFKLVNLNDHKFSFGVNKQTPNCSSLQDPGSFARPYILDYMLCTEGAYPWFSCTGAACGVLRLVPYVTELISTTHYQKFYDGVYNPGCDEVTHTLNYESKSEIGYPLSTYQLSGFSAGYATNLHVTWYAQPDKNMLTQCMKTGSDSQFNGVIYDEIRKSVVDKFTINVSFP